MQQRCLQNNAFQCYSILFQYVGDATKPILRLRASSCVLQVIIAGAPDEAETQVLLTAAHSTYAPDRVVIPIDPANKASVAWYRQHNPQALEMVEGASKEVCVC